MIVGFDDLRNYSDHVLCDGAFDPLHAGHVAYLQAARKLNRGPLLCAVASDDQIREKGREPLLPQESRVAVMEALSDVVYAKDRPTEEVIRQMQPTVYAKGYDWYNKLPQAQSDAVKSYGGSEFYAMTPEDSSTARLRAWALKDAEQSLDRLTLTMGQQEMTPPERYDAQYFAGDWRADGNRYTVDSRRVIEGKHPQILADLFPLKEILDVGCGPGYLVQFLRELGVHAGGIDPSPSAKALAVNEWVIRGYPAQMPSKVADVVICREVLEHLTVSQVCETVRQLFRLAREAVYITTRFHAGPIFDVREERDVDPTHQTLLTQPFLRQLCVLNGGVRRPDLEAALDWQQKGRVLCYASQ